MADAGTGVGMAAMAAASITVAILNKEATIEAATIQTNSADRTADLINDRFQQMRTDFAQYRDIGTAATTQLSNRLNEFTSTANTYAPAMDAEMPELPPVLTYEQLVNTPGYQFALLEGSRATQNAMAARGLGVSGAALRALTTFAVGLASQTYNAAFAQQRERFTMQQQRYLNVVQRFSLDQGLLVNAFNRLNSIVTLGQNSAAQVGKTGVESANQAGSAMQAGATAAAGSILAGANATAGGINGLANAFNSYQQQQAYGLNGQQSGGGSSGGIGRWLGNLIDSNSDGTANYTTGSDGVMRTGAYGE